jgi:uncharacterized membrane protein YheB (UPF0754 family)
LAELTSKKNHLIQKTDLEKAIIDHLQNFSLKWAVAFVLKQGKGELRLITPTSGLTLFSITEF